MVHDTYGTHKVKLPAGHMVVYPATKCLECDPRFSPGLSDEDGRVALRPSSDSVPNGISASIRQADAAASAQ